MARDHLTVADVLGMHTVLMQRYGGAMGVRDPGALEAALFRPQTGYYKDIVAEAAALLESLAINHPFVDGNKRIAAVLFLWFLDQNGGLVGPDGTHSVSPDALVALTLLAAESRSSDAEVVVRLIMHMLAAAESKTPAGAARQASTAV